MMNQNITHVIFDMDGLLLNTEVIYTSALNDALEPFGKKVTYDIKRKFLGMPKTSALDLIVDLFELDIEPGEFGEILESKYTEDLWLNVEKMPGVMKLITYFNDNSIQMAIATGSSPRNFDLKMINHDEIIQNMCHVVKSGDPEVLLGKPNPDIYLVCAKRFKEIPFCASNVLIFEDSIAGVISGLQAGMNVVWVPDSREPEGLPEIPIIQQNHHRVCRITSLNEFDPSLFGLPKFK